MNYKIWEILKELKENYQWVDLTHSFGEDTPKFQGFQPMSYQVVFEFDTAPVKVQEFKLVGQYGTHVDAPAHAVEDGRYLHEIDVKEFVYPLCVIDVHSQVQQNVDYFLSVQDILVFEERYGRIPEGAFVAMRSDWSKRWPSQEKFYSIDEDGQYHYPGWDIAALKFLVEQRKIGAIGHETPDTDPPTKKDQILYAAEVYLLKTNRIQFELMANLDQVSPVGSIIFCTFPKAKNATGFPARCFAICPR